MHLDLDEEAAAGRRVDRGLGEPADGLEGRFEPLVEADRVAAQGSSRVAPTLGWVTIVRESRFSEAMSKYSSSTATVVFQTASKSAEGTSSGFSETGLGATIGASGDWPGRSPP